MSDGSYPRGWSIAAIGLTHPDLLNRPVDSTGINGRYPWVGQRRFIPSQVTGFRGTGFVFVTLTLSNSGAQLCRFARCQPVR